VCKICGRPPHKNKLSIDHDHKYDKIKIKVVKSDGKWYAEAKYKDEYWSAIEYTREAAWKEVKLSVIRASVRGLLCFLCNGGIQHFEDSKAPLAPAERFDNAAKYFREFECRT
jgi:Recombination endonuclease VII